MTKRGELPPHAAAIHLMGKKLLQKLAYLIAPRGEQQPFALFQKLGELTNIGCVGGNRKRRQSLLDPQIVEKSGEHRRIGIRSHQQKEISMRVIGQPRKVTKRVLAGQGKRVSTPSSPSARKESVRRVQ